MTFTVSITYFVLLLIMIEKMHSISELDKKKTSNTKLYKSNKLINII